MTKKKNKAPDYTVGQKLNREEKTPPEIFSFTHKGKSKSGLSRRGFLKSSLTAGGGIVAVGSVSGCSGDDKKKSREHYEDTQIIQEKTFALDGSVLDLDFSPDGTRLASVGSCDHVDGDDISSAVVWDVNSGEKVCLFKGHLLGFPVKSVNYSPNGTQIASVAHSLMIWDSDTGQEIRTYSASYGADFLSVCFSPDANMVAAGTGDSTIYIYDPEKEVPILTHALSSNFSHYISLDFSHDSSRLAVAANNDIEIISIQDASVLLTYSEHRGSVSSVKFFPDGLKLASADTSGEIHVWSSDTGKQIVTMSIESLAYQETTIAISPDGKKLVCSNDASADVFIMDVETGDTLVTYSGHSEPVKALSFSPKGDLIASGDTLGNIHLWQVATGNAIITGSCTCDSVCTCDTVNVCSCDSVCTCNSQGGGGGSYWYPN